MAQSESRRYPKLLAQREAKNRSSSRIVRFRISLLYGTLEVVRMQDLKLRFTSIFPGQPAASRRAHVFPSCCGTLSQLPAGTASGPLLWRHAALLCAFGVAMLASGFPGPPHGARAGPIFWFRRARIVGNILRDGFRILRRQFLVVFRRRGRART